MVYTILFILIDKETSGGAYIQSQLVVDRAPVVNNLIAVPHNGNRETESYIIGRKRNEKNR